MEPRAEYFRYVRDVLGVTSFLKAKDMDHPELEVGHRARTQTGHWPAPAPVDLLVIHQAEQSYFSGEAGDLWAKMRAAMSLGSKRILEVETDQEDVEGVLLDLLNSYPAAVSLILRMDPRRGSDFRVLGSSKVLESFAPTSLVSAPELKKQAWADLQLVMKFLK